LTQVLISFFLGLTIPNMKIPKFLLTVGLALCGALVVSAAPSSTPNPNKTPDKKMPQVTGVPDLTIEKANQTSPDVFIVRIKNLGKTDSATTTLSLSVYTPPAAKGAFPSEGILPMSFPVGPVKAGGVTDVTCKISAKSSKGQRFKFTVNADKKIQESSYSNNEKSVLANPSYK
jgi:CARDB